MVAGFYEDALGAALMRLVNAMLYFASIVLLFALNILDGRAWSRSRSVSLRSATTSSSQSLWARATGEDRAQLTQRFLHALRD